MSASTVSGTIQDPSGQIFANGTWQLIFKPTPNTPGLFIDGGVPFTTLFGGVLDNTGSFSQAGIARNDTIAPAGSKWTLIVSPNANGQAYSVDLNVNSGAFNASAAINAIIANIIVPSTPIAHAYKDSEILLTPSGGSQYYDNVLKLLKVWDTASGGWLSITPAGGSPTFANITTDRVNNRFYVGGAKYPLTQAGVQAAMDDACALDVGQGPNLGGTVILPPGQITLNNQAGQLLSCNCPIELAGSAGEDTIFLVAGGISSAIPVFRFKTTSASGTLFYNIHDIKVQCNIGCPSAGDVFLFDDNATAQGPQAVFMTHVSVLPTTANGFDVSQTGTSNGEFAWHLQDNYFQGNGVKLTNQLADSQYYEHNLFRSLGANPCMDITTIAGAALGWVLGNNMQCSGGIMKVHGTIQPKIAFNQMETLINTETNGAMIDFLGDTAAIDGAAVLHNNLNAHTVGNAVLRFGANSTNWMVEGNKIIPNPTAGVGIAVVAGSTGGVIGPNNWLLTGTATSISGDTAAARITVYGNSGVGLPGMRAWAPSDGDSAGEFIRNSATQTQAILRILDQTKTLLADFDSSGRLFLGSGTGAGPLGALYIETSTPSIGISNLNGAVDAKRWDFNVQPTTFQLRTLNDANPVNNALAVFTVNRSGLTPTNFIFGALPIGLTETTAPVGVAATDLLWGDSVDHMIHQNLNNAGNQQLPIVAALTAQYTNSTTGFTTVGTPNLAFPVAANRNYSIECHLYYQAAATGGLNIQFTGPASPTSVIYGLNDPISATTFGGDGVATAFGTSLGSVVTTAATNFDAIVSLMLVNGANAGTVTLQAKSSAAVQLQIQAGSFCRVQ